MNAVLNVLYNLIVGYDRGNEFPQFPIHDFADGVPTYQRITNQLPSGNFLNFNINANSVAVRIYIPEVNVSNYSQEYLESIRAIISDELTDSGLIGPHGVVLNNPSYRNRVIYSHVVYDVENDDLNDIGERCIRMMEVFSKCLDRIY